MIDIRKEYNVLIKKLNKLKSKEEKLVFECGCVNGYVTEVKLAQDDSKIFPRDMIVVRGVAGFEDKERDLMVIAEDMVKGRDYKYHNKYNVLELFQRYEF